MKLEIIKNEETIPTHTNATKLSQSKLGLFLDCPRCFYFDMELDVKRPPGFPFLINGKLDRDLKQHFDFWRERGESPPELKSPHLIPYQSPRIREWRNNRKGLQYFCEPINLLLMAVLDDLLFNKETKEVHVIDFKATSKKDAVKTADDIHRAFKRQLDFYTWIARLNGLPVSETAYLYHCNSRSSSETFNGELKFEVNLIPYQTDSGWIEAALCNAKECLLSDIPPTETEGCAYCDYLSNSARASILIEEEDPFAI